MMRRARVKQSEGLPGIDPGNGEERRPRDLYVVCDETDKTGVTEKWWVVSLQEPECIRCG
jgi:hypothetical protein